MANWIPLQELFKHQEKYGNMSERHIKYETDSGNIYFQPEETGVNHFQRARSEERLDWRPFMTANGDMYIISHTTEFRLELEGEVGWKNGLRCIERYNKDLYSNTQMGAIGVPITFKQFGSIPNCMKDEPYRYWIAETCDEFASYGIAYVTGTFINYCRLHYKNGEDRHMIVAMRPMVKLPEEVLVDIGDPYRTGMSRADALRIMAR